MSSKSKTKLIQSRPEPPGLEEVKADLEKAGVNDVAFTFFSTFDRDEDTLGLGMQQKKLEGNVETQSRYTGVYKKGGNVLLSAPLNNTLILKGRQIQIILN